MDPDSEQTGETGWDAAVPQQSAVVPQAVLRLSRETKVIHGIFVVLQVAVMAWLSWNYFQLVWLWKEFFIDLSFALFFTFALLAPWSWLNAIGVMSPLVVAPFWAVYQSLNNGLPFLSQLLDLYGYFFLYLGEGTLWPYRLFWMLTLLLFFWKQVRLFRRTPLEQAQIRFWWRAPEAGEPDANWG